MDLAGLLTSCFSSGPVKSSKWKITTFSICLNNAARAVCVFPVTPFFFALLFQPSFFCYLFAERRLCITCFSPQFLILELWGSPRFGALIGFLFHASHPLLHFSSLRSHRSCHLETAGGDFSVFRPPPPPCRGFKFRASHRFFA